MSRIKLTYKENKAFYSDISKQFQEEAEAIIEDTAQNIETDAVSRVSRDKSFLASSINMQVNGLEAEVSARKHYAAYVEFGTGGLVDVPSGLEDYAMNFKGDNKASVNLPARPFLFNSWRENGVKMLERLKKLIYGGK